MPEQLTAHCMKCKQNRGVVEPVVHQDGGRFRLGGKCYKCGTKISKTLGKDDPLVKAYKKFAAEEPDAAQVQSAGGPATPEAAAPNNKSPKGPAKTKKTVAPKKKSKVPATALTPETAVQVVYPLDIFVAYKGKKYTGRMNALDDIRVRGHGRTVFTSLTAAARAITGGTSVNGWGFWSFVHKDGNAYKVDAIRKAEDRTARSKRSSSGPRKTLMPYSTEYPDTYPLPRESLPIRGAAWFLNPKYARWGHLILMTLVEDGMLIHARYDKKGNRKGDVIEMGKFATWGEAIPQVYKFAEESGYFRVRVS